MLAHIDYIRLANLIVAVAALVIWLGIAVKLKDKWAYTVPVLVWIFNCIIFFLVSEFNALGVICVPAETLNLWSAYLRLLSLFIMLGTGIAVLHEDRYIRRIVDSQNNG